jgi:hypothetical protein
MDHVNDKVDLFNDIVTKLIHFTMPRKSVSRNTNDKLWVTDHFIELIKSRQTALIIGNKEEYNRLRNIITRKSKALKRNYYQKNISNLSDRKKLYKEMKNITGQRKTSNLQGMANELANGKLEDLASMINNFFSSICNDLPP